MQTEKGTQRYFFGLWLLHIATRGIVIHNTPRGKI